MVVMSGGGLYSLVLLPLVGQVFVVLKRLISSDALDQNQSILVPGGVPDK